MTGTSKPLTGTTSTSADSDAQFDTVTLPAAPAFLTAFRARRTAGKERRKGKSRFWARFGAVGDVIFTIGDILWLAFRIFA